MHVCKKVERLNKYMGDLWCLFFPLSSYNIFFLSFYLFGNLNDGKIDSLYCTLTRTYVLKYIYNTCIYTFTDTVKMNRKMEMEKTFNYFFIILVGGKREKFASIACLWHDIYELEPLSIAHGAYKRGKTTIWLEL